MNARKPTPDPAGARPIFDEADIGSGEKSPGHAETEEMIRQIPPLPPSGSGRAVHGGSEAAPDSGKRPRP